MYEFLSPYYGFIRLPWMPSLFGVPMPDRGLPGWGWATWLGPEYDEIIEITPSELVGVRLMPDGGRLILLPYPEYPASDAPDSRCLQAYRWVPERIDPQAFHARPLADLSGYTEQRASKVPRFRFLDEGSGADAYRGGPAVAAGLGDLARRAGIRMAEPPVGLSPRLSDLILFALAYGMDAVIESGKLMPFMLIKVGGQRSLSQFPAEMPDTAVTRLRGMLSQSSPSPDICVNCLCQPG